jgi:hypothetical protein
MNSPDDWDSLINQSLGSKSGDVPNKTGPDSEILGTKESSFYAASSPISPKSPESPTKKQGRGNSETFDARAGSVVGQLNCDDFQPLPVVQTAPEHGPECGNCDHLHMQVFHRVKDRRTFHWRCVKGYSILEVHHAGERVHVAPPDCNQYQP